jgi:tetratricopeptide (TPR) repeat protein
LLAIFPGLAIPAGATSSEPSTSSVINAETVAGLPEAGDDEYRYLRQFRESMAGAQYQEAEVSAKQLLEHLQSLEAVPPTSTAVALSNLGLVQRLTGQYESSAQNYRAAISVIQRQDDMLSGRLIEPLQGLATTHRDSGDYGEALRTYDQALHISHVNDGPNSIRQAQVLSGMVDVNLAADNPSAAFGLLDRMYGLYERRYSVNALELLPVLYERAELLNRLDRHGEERRTYRQITRIMTKNYGQTDPALIDPYVAIGRTYMHEASEVVFRSEPTTQNGETFFQMALKVAEANPQLGPETLAACVLALGDYYTVMSVNDLAELQYRRAWDLLSADDLLGVRRAYFEVPVPLRRTALGKYPDFDYGWSSSDVNADELKGGYIVARFKVNARGRVKDVELVESDPPDFSQMETRVRFGVKDFIYRPRILDGEPAASSDILYRHNFFYRTSDLEPK